MSLSATDSSANNVNGSFSWYVLLFFLNPLINQFQSRNQRLLDINLKQDINENEALAAKYLFIGGYIFCFLYLSPPHSVFSQAKFCSRMSSRNKFCNSIFFSFYHEINLWGLWK